MTAALRRGACPSLFAPMTTGDGLLARLVLPEGLSPSRLAGLARAAARLGNGLIEVTSRGSLQIRGLRPDTAPVFAAEIAALGIEPPPGPPVLTGPLAGRDPAEIADPRPLAAALRRFDLPLPPKVSVLVDGGGALHLDAVPADLRLRATRAGWLIAAGGTAATARPLAVLDAAGAIETGLALLGLLSRRRARARDLDLGDLTQPGAGALAPRVPRPPIGRFPLAADFARGLALAFGQAESGTLEALAVAAEGASSLRPAPGGGLIALGLAPGADRRLLAVAERQGLVTDPGDPRLGIVACAGAPACASAFLRTRAMAARIADAARVPVGVRLHLSGCAKRCAQPGGPAVTLLGGAEGPMVTGEGVAVPEGLRAFLLAEAALR